MIFAALMAALPSSAQQADSARGSGVEEIVVTARKREESLQATPIAVTAFTERALDERQVRNIADIGSFIPNVSFDAGSNISGSSSSATLFIRGVGQTDFNLTIDPGVGLYVDGVYVSRAVGALLDTADVARIEVLRGPQGTLFGKNTIGGAVSVISKNPSDTFGGSTDVTTGRYGRFDVRSSIDVPLSSTVLFHGAVSLQTRDGYVRRLSDGGRMGNKNSVSGYGVMTIAASDALDIRIAADGTRTREQANPSTLLAANTAGQFAGFYNAVLSGTNCFTPAAASNPRCFNSQFITGNPYTTWASGPNRSDLDLYGLSVTATYAGLDWVTIKSITAYRDLKSSFRNDTDSSPLPVAESDNDYSQRQLSQEVQFSGTSLEDRLKWILGLYYLKENGRDRNSLHFSLLDLLSGGIVDNSSYAVFSQGTFDITPELALTFGGRYTIEKKGFTPREYILLDRTGGSLLGLSRSIIPANNPNSNLVLPPNPVSTEDDEFTPAVTLDYKFTPEALVYFTYSEGFKAGGFTQRVFPPEPVTPSFAPEFLKSYEIGAKTEWFDRRLRLNAAAFYNDYSDLQIVVQEGIAPKVRNAGTARIQGFELESELVPTDWLRLNASAGFIDSFYRSISAAAAANGITLNNKLPDAPRWTTSVGGTADLWTGDPGTLSLRADWSYKSTTYKDAVNSPQLRQPGYSLVNASLTFETANKAWAVTVGATNLTNQAYLIGGYSELSNLSVAWGSYARPREWFLRVKATY